MPVVVLFTSRLVSLDIQGIGRSEEHTSELQSQSNLVCRLLLEKKKNLFSPSTYLSRAHNFPDCCPPSTSLTPSIWLLPRSSWIRIFAPPAAPHLSPRTSTRSN